jgi:hypothetical protein
MEFVVEKISVAVDIRNRIYGVQLELSPYKFQQVLQIGVSNLGDTYKVGY